MDRDRDNSDKMEIRLISEVSAAGTRGFLLCTISTSGKMEYFFRVYEDSEQTEPRIEKKFTDYGINISDLEIIIIDEFARLCEFSNGRKVIDYSSQVLGRRGPTGDNDVNRGKNEGQRE